MELDNQSQLLKLLENPDVLAKLAKIMEKEKPLVIAPFYKNKHGHIVSGHRNLEANRKMLELTPIFEAEAIQLGLIEQPSVTDTVPKTEEDTAVLKIRAKELGINPGNMGASKLRGEIKKAEMKLNNAEGAE